MPSSNESGSQLSPEDISTKTKTKSKNKKTGSLKSPFQAIKDSLRSSTSASNSKNKNNPDETIAMKLFDPNASNPVDITDLQIQCIPGCKLKTGHHESIQCNSCLIQVHALCVNMTDSTFKDSWRCEKCIHISDNILELIQDMKYVLRDIHDLKVSRVDVKGHLNFLQEKLESTNKELEFLRETNNDLVKQLDTNNELLTTLKNENIQLKDELNKMQLPQQTTNSMNRQQTEPKPALAIGDSMVRNLHSADQKDLMIRTYSGAKMSIIKEKLNLFARDNISVVYIS